MALNGGPPFTFTMGMSIMKKCETQAEIDELWERLSEGGQQVRMRMVDRSLRRLVANRSRGARRVDERCEEGAGGAARVDADEEA